MNKKIGNLIKLTVAISMVLVNLTIPVRSTVNTFTVISPYQVFGNHITRNILSDMEYAVADIDCTDQDITDDPTSSTDLAFNSVTSISYRKVLYIAGLCVNQSYYYCFVRQKDVIRC